MMVRFKPLTVTDVFDDEQDQDMFQEFSRTIYQVRLFVVHRRTVRLVTSAYDLILQRLLLRPLIL